MTEPAVPAEVFDVRAWASLAGDRSRARAFVTALGARLGPAFRDPELIDISDNPDARAPLMAALTHVRSGVLLLLIPGGTATLGRDHGEADERPAHEARIAPFLLAREPLTIEHWELLDRRPALCEDLDDGMPAIGVSWTAAKAWLAEAGAGLRLPSEAEWELACRAGTTTKYPWGEEMDLARCWYGSNAYTRFSAHPPAEHRDDGIWNPLGLVDMCGNVFEWCEDDWIPGYDEFSGRLRDGRPRRAPDVSERVARGGGWNDHCEHCASAFRFKARTDHEADDFGLRPASSLDPELIRAALAEARAA